MTEPDLNDPDLALHEIMARWPETISVFLSHRMLCVGCMVVSFHTVLDACQAYNIDEATFRAALQSAVNA